VAKNEKEDVMGVHKSMLMNDNNSMRFVLEELKSFCKKEINLSAVMCEEDRIRCETLKSVLDKMKELGW